jgi:hypothetical protein
VAAQQGWQVTPGRLAHECHWLAHRGATRVLQACERAGLARRTYVVPWVIKAPVGVAALSALLGAPTQPTGV